MYSYVSRIGLAPIILSEIVDFLIEISKQGVRGLPVKKMENSTSKIFDCVFVRETENAVLVLRGSHAQREYQWGGFSAQEIADLQEKVVL